MATVTNGVVADTDEVVPTEPRPPAMTPDELRALMEREGVARQEDLALIVGVHRITVNRWLKGRTPISEALALLIRDKLKNRKK